MENSKKTIAKFIKTSLPCLFAVLFCNSNYAAETKIQPGFWQHTFKITSQSGQIEAAIAQAKQMLESMPPDQRAMIENMMASRGINLNLQSYTAKVCITEEEAKNNILPKPSDGCEQTITEETADGFKVNYSCSGTPPVTGSGELKIIDSKNFTINATINTVMNGQNEEMTVDQSGKWLQTECTSQ
ncbi:DUF3617 domain-containing protein [Aurantivibrio infirmus]